jgi:hypothetical protein
MKPKLALAKEDPAEAGMKSLFEMFGDEVARWGIVSHMLYPRDEERRIELEHAIQNRSLMERLNRDEPDACYPAVLWQSVAIQGAAVPTLFREAMLPVAQNPSGETLHGGGVAAELLLLPLALKARFGCSVGIGGACRYISFLGRSQGYRGLSERKLAEIWRTYSVVAFWWAALRVLNEGMGDVDVSRFVHMAKVLLDAARAHYADRARDPLLGDDAWCPLAGLSTKGWAVNYEALFTFRADWQEIIFPARAPRRLTPGRLFSPSIVNPKKRFGGD